MYTFLLSVFHSQTSMVHHSRFTIWEPKCLKTLDWSNWRSHIWGKKDKHYIMHTQCNLNKQMFVKHLPPARSEYRVPQRPITKTGTKEGQLTQRYY